MDYPDTGTEQNDFWETESTADGIQIVTSGIDSGLRGSFNKNGNKIYFEAVRSPEFDT
jgi:hypothetical protein